MRPAAPRYRPPMRRTAMRLSIKGRVQGVGYRWWAVETARALGLTGWVRNRRDGSVEALAIGEEELVRRFANACSQGPRSAVVSGVDIAPAQDDGSVDFEQRESA